MPTPTRSRRFGNGSADLARLVSRSGVAVWEPPYRAVARTATADGTGTGAVALGTDFVTVTSADANNIIVLPDAAIGTQITLANGATGYELRTHAPATVGINGGVGAAAESAIAANIVTRVERVSATNWIGESRTAAGVVGVTQVAAP